MALAGEVGESRVGDETSDAEVARLLDERARGLEGGKFIGRDGGRQARGLTVFLVGNHAVAIQVKFRENLWQGEFFWRYLAVTVAVVAPENRVAGGLLCEQCTHPKEPQQ